MKFHITLLLSLFIVGFATAQTQSEINIDNLNSFKQADSVLNVVYKQIQKEYKGETEFLTKLKISQRAWIKFRDAELDAIFPAKDTQYEYGTMYPTCYYIHMKRLTEQRIKQLMIWIRGFGEGETCAGSVHYKAEEGKILP